MKILIQKGLWVLFFMAPSVLFSQISIQRVLVENQVNPEGIGSLAPRFSWKLASIQRNVTQKAYSIQVKEGSQIVWNSGKVSSNQSIFVPYAGATLKSNQAYQVAVQVWDQSGKASVVFKSTFATAFLNSSDWKAKWISSGIAADTVDGRIPLFKKSFVASKKVKQARLFITARGLYEASINGKRIGDAYLTPGWTSYNKHLQYQVYDLTTDINKGQNELNVLVGSGWFRTRIAWENNKNFYGAQTALLSQLEITYADGSTETIASDASWKVSLSSIVASEIYDGEKQDLRIKPALGTPAVETSASFDVLRAQINEPIRKQEQVAVKKVLRTNSGKVILDFGQNVVGWVKFQAKGTAGQQVKLYHVEMLDKFGEPYFANLRSAKAQATYILSGEQESIEPHFTFFGFRYVQVEGLVVNKDDFKAIALHSDMASSGSFESSNALLNQLQSNIRWGQKGNFLDVPTDCPQRDERLGWTGDAQAIAMTSNTLYKLDSFWRNWLTDLWVDQKRVGGVGAVVPDILSKQPMPGDATWVVTDRAGWADAATIVPMAAYESYGSAATLKQQVHYLLYIFVTLYFPEDNNNQYHQQPLQ